ncbi:MAG: chemotaxis protein CheW [Gammaproteobacteria bacterium]|nr:chemotaxis protein CheW [Gammaproteobacteria bacterium]
MSNLAEAVANEVNELSCVLIPAEGEQLLLPNVCVAEIVPWRRIKEVSATPSWCMGFVGWRGQNIPVIHYRGFSEQSESPGAARCLVVMNRARHSTGPAFYGIAAVSLPRMLQLVGEDLVNQEAELGIADALKVTLGTDHATIPNLSFIEDRVQELVGNRA